MKSTGIGVTISGTQIYEFVEVTPLPDDLKETAEVLLNNEVTAEASFWDLLIQPDNFGLPGTKQSQISIKCLLLIDNR